jgi:spore coat protein U-like protein
MMRTETKKMACCRLMMVATVFSVFNFVEEVQGATATTTFTVSATVVASCLVVATDLVFGDYNPTSALNLDGVNTVTVTCTTGTAYTIGLNAGMGDGASVETRKMTSGGNTLEYTLYQDTSRTVLWGNTIGTDTLGATAGAVPTVHNVYGRVFSEQAAPSGVYTDTITVTVDF